MILQATIMQLVDIIGGEPVGAKVTLYVDGVPHVIEGRCRDERGYTRAIQVPDGSLPQVTISPDSCQRARVAVHTKDGQSLPIEDLRPNIKWPGDNGMSFRTVESGRAKPVPVPVPLSLREANFKYIEECRTAGMRILHYACPVCNGSNYTVDVGGSDSMAICVHCKGMHVRIVSKGEAHGYTL